jgi:hypothetical protein
MWTNDSSTPAGSVALSGPVPPRIHLPSVTRDPRYASKFQRNKKGKPTVQKNKYKDISLPKKFELVCVPENGTENGSNPPLVPVMPRRGSDMFYQMEDANMIKVIEFHEGSHDYCKEQIDQSFRHLRLQGYQFYQAEARSNTLRRPTSPIYAYERFDLESLVR